MPQQGSINTDNISLGLGTLEFGTYDMNGAFTAYGFVGAIKAEGTMTYQRTILPFTTGRPLLAVKQQTTEEQFQIQFTLAEVTVANIKNSLGAGSVTSSVIPVFLDGTSNAPVGDLTSSMTAVTASDVLKFGGQCDVNTIGLRFTHGLSCGTGKRQILEVYKASPMGTLALPFRETDWNLYQVEFHSLADTTKPAGQQYCQFIVEQ
jgi:hypothetical protein